MPNEPKLVILDRDGVINVDSDEYIKDADEWHPLPGSLDAIAALTRAGWTVAVATNQSGIARGLFDEYALARIHATMVDAVEDAGGHIELIAFCPHGPDDDCDCRKPKPGLLKRIAAELSLSLDGVPVIGDALRDIQAAEAVGAQAILVLTGKGETTKGMLEGRDIPVHADLASAVDELLKQGDSGK
jgi:D-glycero-D-manno-heptose 1,7-bisphosphate phosphatase